MREILWIKKKLALIVIFVLVLGFALGSIAGGKIESDQCEGLYGYLNEFFRGVGENQNSIDVLKNALLRYGRVYLAIFVGAFFRPGLVLNLYSVGKRGFVSGFTIGTMYKIFGFSGIFANITFLPELIIFFPTLIMFSSSSLRMSVASYDERYRMIKSFIIGSIIYLALFIIVCLCQAYLTHDFLRLISSRLPIAP